MLTHAFVFWFGGACLSAALSALRGAPAQASRGSRPVVRFGALLLVTGVMFCFRALLIELTCCMGPHWAIIRGRPGSLGGAGGRHHGWSALVLPPWSPPSVALVALFSWLSVLFVSSGVFGAFSRPRATRVSSFRATGLSLIRRKCDAASLSPCGAASSALTLVCRRVPVGAGMVYPR